MASKKIDELTNLTSLASDDLLIAYDISEPGGEKTKKISKTNAFNGLSVDGHTHDAYLPLAGGNLSGNLTVGGNLTVTGTQFIANVQTVEITDNLMLLNKNETGPGVTAGTAGLEIERGTATNYKFLFDEPTDTFRVGMEGSLQAVATRADAPTNSGIAFWNDTLKRFDTSSLTPGDIGTGISYHGNEYHTVEFATVSGLTAVSGSLQDQLDNFSGMEAHGNEYHTSAFITTTVTGSMTIQGITVGLGTGSVDSNTVFGVGALASNATGSHLTAIGYYALNANTVPNNTAIGWNALRNNTDGGSNTAVGVQSLNTNTTGSNNTALGMSAMYANTTGTNNVAIGSDTLTGNTTGHNNIAIGFVALQSNTDQSNNTAVGHYTLRGNTAGYENTAIGNYAMGQGTITGGQNTAVGRVSLTFNTSGAQNSSLGFESLGKNTTGSYNVGVGANAGTFITGGVVNNETSSNSVYIGYSTKAKADGDTNEIVIGSGAIGDGSNTVTLGNTDITKTVLRGEVKIPKLTVDGPTSQYSTAVNINHTGLLGTTVVIDTNNTGIDVTNRWGSTSAFAAHPIKGDSNGFYAALGENGSTGVKIIMPSNGATRPVLIYGAGGGFGSYSAIDVNVDNSWDSGNIYSAHMQSSGNGVFSGNFLSYKKNSVTKFTVDNEGVINATGGTITGDFTIGGNLTVTGTQFIADVQTVQVEDNLILLNKNEPGAGVTAGVAGIEVERGTETNYQFYFDESQDNFRVGVSGSLQAVATRQDEPTMSGIAYWNNSQTRFDTASGFTVQDIATKTYLSSVFSNKYEIFTTSGTTTVTTDFDLAEGAVGVYVDGVRQHNSAFTFSSPRTIILSDTVASGTAIAVIAMEADSVQAMSNKVNTVVSGTTNNLTKLTASGNIADAGVSAASVIEVVNTYRRRNVIINGGMNFWQRGTTSNFATSTTGYLADRFKVTNATDGTLTCTRGTSNTPANTGQYIWLTPIVADTSLAASQAAVLQYFVEGYDIVPLINKTCTLSFWAYGSVAGTYCVSIQNCGTLPPDRSYIVEYTLSGGSAFEYKTITFPMHDLLSGSNWNTTNGGGLRITWCIGAGTDYQTATTNTWKTGVGYATSNQVNIMANTSYGFGLTGVQLELGSVATPFEFRHYGEELALCQRYYEKSYIYTDAPGTATLNGETAYISPIAGTVYANVTFKVTKRNFLTTSTLKPYSVSNGAVDYVRNITAGTNMAASAVVISENACLMQFTAADGNLYAFQWTADAEL